MTVAVREPVQELSDCLDVLRAELSGLDDAGLTRMLWEIEEISRKAQSVMLDAVAEAEARGISVREGFGNTARLLAGMLRLSARSKTLRIPYPALGWWNQRLPGRRAAHAVLGSVSSSLTRRENDVDTTREYMRQGICVTYRPRPARPATRSCWTNTTIQYPACASGGTIHGMHKTTVYLPADLKCAVSRYARRHGISEAEVIRQAVADAVAGDEIPRPRGPLFSSAVLMADDVDAHLDGFGQQ